jgi:hypothetical protein
MASTFQFTEALDLATYTTVPGVFFGINAALYFHCARLSFLRHHKAPANERTKVLFLFVYTSVVVFAAAAELGFGSRLMQWAYIDHGGTHGEPIEFESEFIARTSAFAVAGYVPFFVIGNMIEAMQVGRKLILLPVINPSRVDFPDLAGMDHLDWITLCHSCNCCTNVPSSSSYGLVGIQRFLSSYRFSSKWFLIRTAGVNIWYTVYRTDDNAVFKKLALFQLAITALSVILVVLITSLIAGRLLAFRRRHLKIFRESEIVGVFQDNCSQ